MILVAEHNGPNNYRACLYITKTKPSINISTKHNKITKDRGYWRFYFSDHSLSSENNGSFVGEFYLEKQDIVNDVYRYASEIWGFTSEEIKPGYNEERVLK